MSKENVLLFIERVNRDEALQKQLASTSQITMEHLLSVAKDAGFDFTGEEYLAVSAEKWSSQLPTPAELTESELDAVAGGLLPAVQSPGSDAMLNFTLQLNTNLNTNTNVNKNTSLNLNR